MNPFYLFIFDISINLTRARVPPLLANTSFYKVSFIHYFRIEISDHGASEGSDDTLPNETTVKFINEVSSKVSHLLVLRGHLSWSRKFF